MYDDEEDEEEEKKPTTPESRIHPPIETLTISEAPYVVKFTAAYVPQQRKRRDISNPLPNPNPVRRDEGDTIECTASIIHERWAITAAHCRPYVRTNQFIYYCFVCMNIVMTVTNIYGLRGDPTFVLTS
jgi:hypothetical protein